MKSLPILFDASLYAVVEFEPAKWYDILICLSLREDSGSIREDSDFILDNLGFYVKKQGLRRY